MGFELRPISNEEQKALNVENGVKVISIRKGSKIDRTNVKPGFVITKVNDKMIKTVNELVAIIEKSDSKVMLEGIYEDYSGEFFYAFKK